MFKTTYNGYPKRMSFKQFSQQAFKRNRQHTSKYRIIRLNMRLNMIDTYRGNKIEKIKKGRYRYVDTKKGVSETDDRPCGYCGLTRKDGHDNCLATLIGTMNACCGHGIESDAYIQFLDGESIGGKDAIVILDILKKYKIGD